MKLAVDIIAAAQAMNARGINAGTSGNVSARTQTGMLITPSAMDYDQLTPDDIVAMDFDTTWFATSNLRPSSEWRFHLDIYANRPDVRAIVHCHSTYATAIAVHGRDIGPFHYMVAVAGGHDIRCAPYATFGSQELSDNAVKALEGRSACLLAHHGMIAVGEHVTGALELAAHVEELARQYLAASVLGEPPELTRTQIDQVVAKMSAAGYGSSPGFIDEDPGAKVLHLDR